MKIEIYPVGEEQHVEADKNFRKAAENNKRVLREIATQVEKGEPLTHRQEKLAAAALRHVADIMPTERPKPNKRPNKVPGDAALCVAIAVVEGGKKKIEAMEALAAQWDVDVETVEQAIKRQGYKHWKKHVEFWG